MDAIKKRILRDVFVSPWTLVPMAAGVVAFAAAWGLDGNLALNLVGAGGVLGGIGAVITRLIFGADKIAENALYRMRDQQRRERNAELDALDRQLAREPDPRTEDCLRQLRRLYDGFQADVESRKLSGHSPLMLEQVEQVFSAAVNQLRLSFDLWTTAQGLKQEAKQSVLQQREAVVQEVLSTVEHLARIVEQFHSFQVQRGSTELERLRAELDETLLVARRTEERLAKIENPRDYKPSDFEAKE